MFYSLIRPLLFNLSPETAHDLTLHIAKLAPWLGDFTGISFDQRHQVTVGGVTWSSPVGLAAGLDKNAEALDFFSQQGFGCIECGTITLHPQLGNPKPRIFRYPSETSLRNAMGFPNKGFDVINQNLRAFKKSIPLGINIGKNKDVTSEQSIKDLTFLVEKLNQHADYFVINVSSPNTPGLRDLQDKYYLSELFKSIQTLNSKKDFFIKISPDLTREKIIELGELALDLKLTGIICSNTTLVPELGPGGISGKLLQQKSNLCRRILCQMNLPIEIIGVGGISSPRDLFEFWNYGGKVVQIYTSYVYQGSEVLRVFRDSLNSFLKKNQLQNLNSFFNLSLEERKKMLAQINF